MSHFKNNPLLRKHPKFRFSKLPYTQTIYTVPFLPHKEHILVHYKQQTINIDKRAILQYHLLRGRIMKFLKV
jgi:hypothetical protein